MRAPVISIAANPAAAALRLGEEIRHADPPLPPPLGAAELVAAASGPPPEQPAARFGPTPILLAALALGALLLVFSATPDAVLSRSPRGVAAARARVEVGLIGGAIVALASVVYLTAASS